MEIKESLLVLSLTISIISLIVSIIVALTTHRRSIGDTADEAITNLVRMQFDHPELRDKAKCDELLNRPPDDTERLRLDAYCIMVYNTLEYLYQKFGERRIKSPDYFVAMKAVAQRHRAWLYKDDHVDGYKLDMIKFLEEESR